MFQNEWFLDLDIKFAYTGFSPVYRRGDTSVLKMRLHDNTLLYDLTGATDAKITIIMPSGLTMENSCEFIESDVGKIIVFKFEPINMIEIGTYNIILTVSDGIGKVSVQPFKVRFFDSLNSANQSLIEMIRDLQNQINNLDTLLANTIKQEEKAIPEGVATLDKTGRIPEKQVPIYLLEHLNEEAYSTKGAHGFRVNTYGLGMYKTPNDKWEYLGYSDAPLLSLKLNTTVTDGIVNLIYTGEDTVSIQKWLYGSKDRNDFDSAGNTIVGLSFPVSEEGTYTIYYEDSTGNSYLHRFMVSDSQLAKPNVDIEIGGGIVVVKPERPLALIKWDYDIRNIPYFQNNGNIVTDNNFKITIAGTYTLYYKTTGGKEYIKVFTATEEDVKPNIVIALSENNQNEIQVSITSKAPLIKKKWDVGNLDIEYFATKGNNLTSNLIPYSSSGFYTVYAEDSTGFEAVETIEVVYKDITPPVITLTPNTSDFTNQNIVVTINVSDSSSIETIKWASGNRPIEYFTNGGVESQGTQEVDANGIYTAYAKDTAGNEAVQTITINTIDKVAPTATASQVVSGNKSTITITAQDDLSGIESIISPDNTTTNASIATYVAYDNTTYNFTIADKASNTYILPVVVSGLDITPPSLSLSSAPTSWTTGNVIITATASDTTGIKVTKWTSGSVPITYFKTGGTVFTNTFTVTTSGIYTVYAEDNSGNDTIQTINITNIDRTAPTASATQQTSGNTKIITVNASDNQSGVNRIVAPNGVITYASTAQYTATGNGTYSFAIFDNAGNVYTLEVIVTGLATNTYTDVYTGAGAMYRIDTNGDAYANGSNTWYRLGTGNTNITSKDDDVPNKVLATGIKKIVAGNSLTLYLTESGDVYATGSNSERYLGANLPSTITSPTKLTIISNIVDIVTDLSSSGGIFAKNRNGEWFAWGNNNNGCLGLGNTNTVTTPTKITTLPSSISSIFIDNNTTYFNLTNGQVYACGRNDYYQLGQGDTVNRSTPVLISSLSNIKQVKVVRRNGFFLNTSGQLYGVGLNQSYELGLGDRTVRTTPVLIAGANSISRFDAGEGFTIALRTDGSLIGWGSKDRIGTGGAFEYTTTPTVLSLSGVRSFSSNTFGSVFITTGNAIYGIGDNSSNQYADSSLPNEVITFTRLNNW